jgi:hypothetical protein
LQKINDLASTDDEIDMNGRLKGDPLDYEKYYLKFGVQITDDESLYEKS